VPGHGGADRGIDALRRLGRSNAKTRSNCGVSIDVCYPSAIEGESSLRLTALLFCVILAACGPYPRDVSGTLDAIEQHGRVRVGLADLRREDEPLARAFISRVERATGARADVDTGHLESQLARLEEGELDLVIGELAVDTPWAPAVAIVEPLRQRREGERVLGLSPVTANGENRWVALLEREVRDTAAKGGA
jgi:hypothetical protein